MSYVRKASKGYYGYANYVDKDGHRHRKSAGHFKLKREALESANKLESELASTNLDLKDISLVDYYSRWYEIYKENSISDITKNRYDNVKKMLEKHFGDAKLQDIKRSDYQEFINSYGANHAPETVHKLNGIVRACVSYAIDDDIIRKDFTNHVQLVSNKDRVNKVQYLTNDELVSLKDDVIAGLNPLNTSRYMILTAIYTGMRKSEIQALTWNDVDFMHSTIDISKTWDERKKAFKPTKTESSKRTIKVNRELLKYLADLKTNNSTMVFRNVLGTIPTSNALNKCLRSIMSSAGMKKQGFHFHSLRHVHVAFLLSQGVDIYAISKRLGHSNITITLNTYSYLIDEYKAKSDTVIIDKLAKL